MFLKINFLLFLFISTLSNSQEKHEHQLFMYNNYNVTIKLETNCYNISLDDTIDLKLIIKNNSKNSICIYDKADIQLSKEKQKIFINLGGENYLQNNIYDTLRTIKSYDTHEMNFTLAVSFLDNVLNEKNLHLIFALSYIDNLEKNEALEKYIRNKDIFVNPDNVLISYYIKDLFLVYFEWTVFTYNLN